MKIISVVGARPNFVKIAPFIKVINSYNASKRKEDVPVEHILVHTGQHYDVRMSESFFLELNMPEPDINLGIGSGSHAEQVGNTMIAFEKVIRLEKPDWVVVVGDVNATLACSVTAKKEGVRCCHIEAGLRSGDLSMPEEINRLVTDRVSDLLLAPDMLSIENLRKEGASESSYRLVGNIMIDTLESFRERASQLSLNEIVMHNFIKVQEANDCDFIDKKKIIMDSLNKIDLLNQYPINSELSNKPFAVITLHRPSNVDNRRNLKALVDFFIEEATKYISLVWPVHPRTRKQLLDFNLYDDLYNHSEIILLEPIGYLEMLRLNMDAKLIITDSGGLQEECTILGTPCLTLRLNTERPITLRENGGVSVLLGNDINRLHEEIKIALKKTKIQVRPEMWDGKAAQRSLNAILAFNTK